MYIYRQDRRDERYREMREEGKGHKVSEGEKDSGGKGNTH